MENAKTCTLLVLLTPTKMTFVTFTENHGLESALYKAMVLHTFLGTGKMI